MKRYIEVFLTELTFDLDISTEAYTRIKELLDSQARVADVRAELIKIGEHYEII